MDWFILKCGESPTSEYNYTKVDNEPSCTGKISICSVRAYANEHNQPILTTELKSEMIRALLRRRDTEHVRLHNC